MCDAPDDFRVYDIERVWMLRRALDLIDTLAPVSSILDCACNIGYWMDACRRRFPQARIVGIDSDGANIERARTLRPHFQFAAGDTRSVLGASNETFDAVLCMGMLYYYHDFEAILKLLADHCRIGMLVDTFCLAESNPSPESIIETLDNPENKWTRAAGSDARVRIPNIAALKAALTAVGFHTRRIDEFTGRYDASVGTRLGHPLQRVGLIAVKLENTASPDKSWSGWASR